MVEAVNDNHEKTGLTKAPAIPVPQINVEDVEAKPDPKIIEANEVIDAPDSTKATPEVAKALA